MKPPKQHSPSLSTLHCFTGLSASCFGRTARTTQARGFAHTWLVLVRSSLPREGSMKRWPGDGRRSGVRAQSLHPTKSPTARHATCVAKTAATCMQAVGGCSTQALLQYADDIPRTKHQLTSASEDLHWSPSKHLSSPQSASVRSWCKIATD